MKRIVLTLSMIALAGALFTTTASAATNICEDESSLCTSTSTDSFTGKGVCIISGKTINGGLTVTGDCILVDDTINGGVKMNAKGKTLQVCGTSTLTGGLQVQNASCVTLGLNAEETAPGDTPTSPCPGQSFDTISGGVQVQNLSGGASDCFKAANSVFESEDATISGGVQVTNNPVGEIELETDTVSGGVQINNNGGPIDVTGNNITGGLQCAGNGNTGTSTVTGNMVTGGGTCNGMKF